jgi:hypothetical protein
MLFQDFAMPFFELAAVRLPATLTALCLPLSFTLATLGFAKGDAAQLALGNKEAFFLGIAQHTLSLYFCTKALEQLFLRLVRFKCHRCQLESPLSVDYLPLALRPEMRTDCQT